LQALTSIALLLMLELEDAVARILSEVPLPEAEQVALNAAHGRVALDPISAPIDLPSFDNSAMDGYAVRAQDVATAGIDTPVRLKLSGKIAAGEAPQGPVAPGCAVRIFTGSALPAEADCVVMQEDTAVDAKEPGVISILDAGRPWENVRLRGEDVRAGAVVTTRGQVITAGVIALLGALGISRIRVGRQPSVGILATGSELWEAGQTLARGQIYESNRAGLAALVRLAGAHPIIFPIVPDSLAGTADALSEALSRCDTVITIGGASVGEFDFIKPAMEQLGLRLNFWRVAMKPGRPFLFGQADTKLVFGLPGNPVSALVTFLLLVRPALRRWQGAAETGLPLFSGTLAEPLSNDGSRRHFLRVQLTRDGVVAEAGTQASHVLSSFAKANGLVDVSPKTTLPAGETVMVRLWES
jgi:molybdopterin molybdotransferase